MAKQNEARAANQPKSDSTPPQATTESITTLDNPQNSAPSSGFQDFIDRWEKRIAIIETRISEFQDVFNKLIHQVESLKDITTAVGVSKVMFSQKPHLYTDDPMNLFKSFRQHLAGGQITKPDMENLLQFATEGEVYFSRVIPRNQIKMGKEAALFTVPSILGTMQLMTGKGQFYPVAQDNLKSADYLLYVGVSTDGQDGNLTLRDPRKRPGHPDDFVGVTIGFTITKPPEEEKKKDETAKPPS